MGSWALKDMLSGARFRVGVAPFSSWWTKTPGDPGDYGWLWYLCRDEAPGGRLGIDEVLDQ